MDAKYGKVIRVNPKVWKHIKRHQKFREPPSRVLERLLKLTEDNKKNGSEKAS